jgi:hypothetical protein
MTVLKRNLFVLSCLALSLAQKKADAQEHLPFQYSHQHIMRADEQLRQEFYVLAAQSAGRHLAQQQLSGIPYHWQDEDQPSAGC